MAMGGGLGGRRMDDKGVCSSTHVLGATLGRLIGLAVVIDDLVLSGLLPLPSTCLPMPARRARSISAVLSRSNMAAPAAALLRLRRRVRASMRARRVHGGKQVCGSCWC